MGFLHIGWDLATTEASDEKDLMSSSPAWEAASKVHPPSWPEVPLRNGPGVPESAGGQWHRYTAEGSLCCVMLG